jgi:hypothetical protein
MYVPGKKSPTLPIGSPISPAAAPTQDAASKAGHVPAGSPEEMPPSTFGGIAHPGSTARESANRRRILGGATATTAAQVTAQTTVAPKSSAQKIKDQDSALDQQVYDTKVLLKDAVKSFQPARFQPTRNDKKMPVADNVLTMRCFLELAAEQLRLELVDQYVEQAYTHLESHGTPPPLSFDDMRCRARGLDQSVDAVSPKLELGQVRDHLVDWLDLKTLLTQQDDFKKFFAAFGVMADTPLDTRTQQVQALMEATGLNESRLLRMSMVNSPTVVD